MTSKCNCGEAALFIVDGLPWCESCLLNEYKPKTRDPGKDMRAANPEPVHILYAPQGIVEEIPFVHYAPAGLFRRLQPCYLCRRLTGVPLLSPTRDPALCRGCGGLDYQYPRRPELQYPLGKSDLPVPAPIQPLAPTHPIDRSLRYKRVQASGDQLVSYASSRAEVVYLPGEWVRAPDWLAREGYHLLCYTEADAARPIAIDREAQVWEVEVRDQVSLPAIASLPGIAGGNIFQERQLPNTLWPSKTEMYKEVKLVRRLS